MLQPKSTPSVLEGGSPSQTTKKQISSPGIAFWAQVTPPSSPPPDVAQPKTTTLPEGWELHYHPKTRFRYFFHRPSHLLTNLDLLDASLSDPAESVYAVATDVTVSIPEGWEQVFNPPVKDWEAMDRLSAVWKPVRTTPLNREQVQPWRGFASQRPYWNYVIAHPCHHSFQPKALDDVTKVLVECRADYALHSGNDAAFPLSDCDALLSIVKDFNCFFLETRDEAKSARTSKRRASLFRFVINLAFLNVPSSYLKRIKKVWGEEWDMESQDDSNRFHDRNRFTAFITGIIAEWNAYNLIATLLLSAGVGFLALPGIGNVAKVTGVISVQCSLGSLILGVYYARQHERDLAAKNAVRAIMFFSALGAVLSFMPSLPLVMLCWALLSFVVGIMVWILTSHAPASTAVVSTTFSLLVCATIAGFVFFRDIWETV